MVDGVGKLTRLSTLLGGGTSINTTPRHANSLHLPESLSYFWVSPHMQVHDTYL